MHCMRHLRCGVDYVCDLDIYKEKYALWLTRDRVRNSKVANEATVFTLATCQSDEQMIAMFERRLKFQTAYSCAVVIEGCHDQGGCTVLN
jgi:hypothetical protein